MRILVSGDSHCDVNHVKSMESKAEKFDCDRIFVVGDYGFWPRQKGGEKFLSTVAKLDIPVYFLAGNHEDWEILKEHEADPERTDEGFIEVHKNSFYAPTGHSWEWDGVKFLAVGGAYSIDRARRTKFISWFPDEIITEEDVASCMGVGEVDILLSHDAPASVDMALQFAYQYGDMKVLDECVGTHLNRQRLQVVVDMVHPTALIHGHWHLSYRVNSGGVDVYGLNCNGNPDYYTVIDTEDFT